ncbi:hypothetical protein [Nocardioides sp.]|uniref:hypothetical protein n=1 Tax=Nocardioides sp. TaxID=35761 RepID=UPI003783BC31
MKRLLHSLLNPPMAVALLALVIALGGTSYAVTQLPKNSVGTPQLKSNAVTSPKVKDGSLKSTDFGAGQLPAGPQGEQGPPGEQGAPGADGSPAFAMLSGRGTMTGANRSFSLDGAFSGAATDVSTLSPSVEVVVRNFQVEASVAPGAGKFFSPRLNVDGDLTSLCNIQDTATSCTAPGPITIPAGSQVHLGVVVPAGTPTSVLRWGMTVGTP